MLRFVNDYYNYIQLSLAVQVGMPGPGWDYEFDSPNVYIYKKREDYPDDNPLKFEVRLRKDAAMKIADKYAGKITYEESRDGVDPEYKRYYVTVHDESIVDLRAEEIIDIDSAPPTYEVDSEYTEYEEQGYYQQRYNGDLIMFDVHRNPREKDFSSSVIIETSLGRVIPLTESNPGSGHYEHNYTWERDLSYGETAVIKIRTSVPDKIIVSDDYGWFYNVEPMDVMSSTGTYKTKTPLGVEVQPNPDGTTEFRFNKPGYIAYITTDIPDKASSINVIEVTAEDLQKRGGLVKIYPEEVAQDDPQINVDYTEATPEHIQALEALFTSKGFAKDEDQSTPIEGVFSFTGKHTIVLPENISLKRISSRGASDYDSYVGATTSAADYTNMKEFKLQPNPNVAELRYQLELWYTKPLDSNNENTMTRNITNTNRRQVLSIDAIPGLKDQLNTLTEGQVEVIDNLTSTDTDKALSANQGKELKGMIDGINTLLQSDDTDLDSIQEIVTKIKENQSLLDGLTVKNIAGLLENDKIKESLLPTNVVKYDAEGDITTRHQDLGSYADTEVPTSKAVANAIAAAKEEAIQSAADAATQDSLESALKHAVRFYTITINGTSGSVSDAFITEGVFAVHNYDASDVTRHVDILVENGKIIAESNKTETNFQVKVMVAKELA